jgi:hypothetical protein
VNVFYEQALKFLTPDSDLTEMLRTMYRTGVDYCVMLPSWDSRNHVIFTKDQLVSLIERNSASVRVSDIPKLAAEGVFKPLLFSDRPAVPNGIDADPGELQVLVIKDDRARISSFSEAIASRGPDFPAWWDVPIPLVMYRRRKLHPNATAAHMFGEGIGELPHDLLERDEFLVDVQGGRAPRSLMFRRLEGDIFTLEDCTGDVLAAADITWWAAVGKAWIAILDKGKREYRRCEKAEIEEMDEDELAAISADNTLIPCEWEGGILGYLCVKKKTVKPKADRAGVRKRPAEERAGTKPRAAVKEAPKENDVLRVLGPQAMGLLTPGAVFPPAEDGGEGPSSPREKQGPQKDAKRARNG